MVRKNERSHVGDLQVTFTLRERTVRALRGHGPEYPRTQPATAAAAALQIDRTPFSVITRGLFRLGFLEDLLLVLTVPLTTEGHRKIKCVVATSPGQLWG